MRIVLLLSLCVVPPVLAAQAPAATQPAPAQPRASRAAARTTLVVTATDPTGATLPGVRVEVLGASDRSGNTDESGTIRFTNMRAGTHRIRFSGDGVIGFEREVTVRAGQTADVDVTLNPAPEPPPPAAPPPPEPAPAPVGPVGPPKTVDIPELADANLIRREPRRDSPIACSGNARAMLVQLNEPQPERLYENAEAMYYVVAGEGTLRMDGRDSPLVAGTFVMVPRGTAFGIARRGRNPLVLLNMLSGEPCEAAL